MQLRRIEVVGFKSFADRQVLSVDSQVTAVIGPNGCGKSNIVDAIRWCMGEQSAKHLRGAGMADVIFTGCSSRGPAGMAEVTLTFEREDADVAKGVQPDEAPGPFDHPNVAITRRLYADGTSEYLINKIPSRLRDITDLLMGTGVGTKGYSIIEQGQVGRIVSSKPEERRHIIDEAAGITRFKAQKAAAQRKIDATRQNLLRVHDVVAELETRLGSLKRQAQKAGRYKRYKTELRDLELWSASHKFLELSATGAVLEQRRADLATAVDDIRTALAARETQIEAKRTSIAEVEVELSSRQQKVFDLDNRVKLLEAEDEYRRREHQDATQRAAAARAEGDVAERGLSHLREELAHVDAEREALGDGTGPDGALGVVERLQGQAARVESEHAAERERTVTGRAELGELRTSVAADEARVASHRQAVQSLRARVAELEAGQEALQRSQIHLGADHGTARAQADQSVSAFETLERGRVELDRLRAQLREQVAGAEVELDTKRAEVHRCRSRLQSLEEIQARYRGCQSGVQVVMEHRRELALRPDVSGGMSETEAPRESEAVHGILADYIRAPEHLERAVSAMLGDRLEGVVVDDPPIAARGVELLKREQEGRTTFVPRQGRVPPTTPTRPTWAPVGSTPSGIEVVDLADRKEDPGGLAGAPGVLGRLADLIEVTGEMGPLCQALFGDAMVVETMSAALELWERHRTRHTLVTLDGDRLEPTGVVVGGSPTALNSALLQQKREIRELEEILAELADSFESTRARHLGLAQELASVESQRETGEVEMLAAQERRLAAQGACERLVAEIGRVTAELEGLATQHAAAQADVTTRSEEIATFDATLAQRGARVAELEQGTAASERRVDELAARREQLGRELTDAKVDLARWQQQTDALGGTASRLRSQVDAETDRIAKLRESASASAAKATELEQATAQAATEREQLVQRSKAATAAVSQSRERYDALRLEQDELEASVRTLRDDLDGRRERLGEVDLGLQESGLERQHLVRDTRERFDEEIAFALSEFHARRPTGTTEQSRQKELKRILSRMGEVNLTAIDEYEQVSERYTFLTGQREDLEHAIQQLQAAIDKINKTTRQRFKETFEAVGERFSQIFPRLFNGGRAELRMTDPTDLLATGVEIIAQPPGKQLRSLDLLSGGEKALTAVSLIFAVFLIKPSPFCLLDEVDAPLDDANVGRFNRLVRELADSTQFVIITHNKVTMETADRLYGVTMEQRGVSKLVSVNLRRAVELAYN